MLMVTGKCKNAKADGNLQGVVTVYRKKSGGKKS